MRGSMLIIRPSDRMPELTELDRLPDLDELQATVGGYLEAVQGFDTVAYAGVVMSCVAFGNDRSKLDKLPPNATATAFWAQALRRKNISLLDEKTREPKDWLAGPIIILFGDKEFMNEL